MDKKTIIPLIVLIFLISCLGIVSAGNNTTDNLTVEDVADNLTSYIIPSQITDNGIEFSDGFTGFCIDSSKNIANMDSKFTSQNTANDGIQNHVKLAIIECYKSGKESNIKNVIDQLVNGNKNYDIVPSVLSSAENIGDTATVNINNTTEATFTFELLKPADESQSECLAYKVSFETIESNDTLTAGSNETNTSENATQNNTSKNTTDLTNNTAAEQNNDSMKENATVNDTKMPNENQTAKNETNKTENNETDIVIDNETNITIIHQNNTKIINKTNEVPQNAPIQNTLMRTLGNPIFLLAIVIIIVAVVAVAIRRKD